MKRKYKTKVMVPELKYPTKKKPQNDQLDQITEDLLQAVRAFDEYHASQEDREEEDR